MSTITIRNNGPLICDTNFWGSPAERNGRFYCSVNAGTLRLLVPRSQVAMVATCRTAKYVIVSLGPWPDESVDEAIELLFEDHSDSPYSIHLSSASFVDGRLPAEPPPGTEWQFSAWLPTGQAFQLPCRWRRSQRLPDLSPWPREKMDSRHNRTVSHVETMQGVSAAKFPRRLQALIDTHGAVWLTPVLKRAADAWKIVPDEAGKRGSVIREQALVDLAALLQRRSELVRLQSYAQTDSDNGREIHNRGQTLQIQMDNRVGEIEEIEREALLLLTRGEEATAVLCAEEPTETTIPKRGDPIHEQVASALPPEDLLKTWHYEVASLIEQTILLVDVEPALNILQPLRAQLGVVGKIAVRRFECERQLQRRPSHVAGNPPLEAELRLVPELKQEFANLREVPISGEAHPGEDLPEAPVAPASAEGANPLASDAHCKDLSGQLQEAEFAPENWPVWGTPMPINVVGLPQLLLREQGARLGDLVGLRDRNERKEFFGGVARNWYNKHGGTKSRASAETLFGFYGDCATRARELLKAEQLGTQLKREHPSQARCLDWQILKHYLLPLSPVSKRGGKPLLRVISRHAIFEESDKDEEKYSRVIERHRCARISGIWDKILPLLQRWATRGSADPAPETETVILGLLTLVTFTGSMYPVRVAQKLVPQLREEFAELREIHKEGKPTSLPSNADRRPSSTVQVAARSARIPTLVSRGELPVQVQKAELLLDNWPIWNKDNRPHPANVVGLPQMLVREHGARLGETIGIRTRQDRKDFFDSTGRDWYKAQGGASSKGNPNTLVAFYADRHVRLSMLLAADETELRTVKRQTSGEAPSLDFAILKNCFPSFREVSQKRVAALISSVEGRPYSTEEIKDVRLTPLKYFCDRVCFLWDTILPLLQRWPALDAGETERVILGLLVLVTITGMRHPIEVAQKLVPSLHEEFSGLHEIFPPIQPNVVEAKPASLPGPWREAASTLHKQAQALTNAEPHIDLLDPLHAQVDILEEIAEEFESQQRAEIPAETPPSQQLESRAACEEPTAALRLPASIDTAPVARPSEALEHHIASTSDATAFRDEPAINEEDEPDLIEPPEPDETFSGEAEYATQVAQLHLERMLEFAERASALHTRLHEAVDAYLLSAQDYRTGLMLLEEVQGRMQQATENDSAKILGELDAIARIIEESCTQGPAARNTPKAPLSASGPARSFLLERYTRYPLQLHRAIERHTGAGLRSAHRSPFTVEEELLISGFDDALAGPGPDEPRHSFTISLVFGSPAAGLAEVRRTLTSLHSVAQKDLTPYTFRSIGADQTYPLRRLHACTRELHASEAAAHILHIQMPVLQDDPRLHEEILEHIFKLRAQSARGPLRVVLSFSPVAAWQWLAMGSSSVLEVSAVTTQLQPWSSEALSVLLADLKLKHSPRYVDYLQRQTGGWYMFLHAFIRAADSVPDVDDPEIVFAAAEGSLASLDAAGARRALAAFGLFTVPHIHSICAEIHANKIQHGFDEDLLRVIVDEKPQYRDVPVGLLMNWGLRLGVFNSTSSEQPRAKSCLNPIVEALLERAAHA